MVALLPVLLGKYFSIPLSHLKGCTMYEMLGLALDGILVEYDNVMPFVVFSP